MSMAWFASLTSGSSTVPMPVAPGSVTQVLSRSLWMSIRSKEPLLRRTSFSDTPSTWLGPWLSMMTV